MDLRPWNDALSLCADARDGAGQVVHTDVSEVGNVATDDDTPSGAVRSVEEGAFNASNSLGAADGVVDCGGHSDASCGDGREVEADAGAEVDIRAGIDKDDLGRFSGDATNFSDRGLSATDELSGDGRDGRNGGKESEIRETPHVDEGRKEGRKW
ncbi:hypothetical protein C8J57DRAFT_1314765 [Mycena rebaudengoi]|nr:hypothetical protein C8J57DRAFT_1314765 [Mycena rebaudengoi]